MATWMLVEVSPDVLKPFLEVFIELANNVAQSSLSANAEERVTEFSPLEAYYEQLRGSGGELTETDTWPSVQDDGWPESYVTMLEQAETWDVAPGLVCGLPMTGCSLPTVITAS